MSWTDTIESRQLPYPVAVAFRRYQRVRRQGGPLPELEGAFDLVEETLRYANARLAADHLESRLPFEPEAASLLAKKQTLGDRVQLLHHLADGLESPLADVVNTSWRQRAGLGAALTNLVRHRNEVRHGSRPSEVRAAEHLDSVEQSIQVFSAVLVALSEERLYSVYTPATAGRTPTLMSWNGPHVAEDGVELDFDLPPVSPGACFAIAGTSAVFLGPMIVARDEPLADDQDLWVYDHGTPSVEGTGSVRWSNARLQKVDIPSSVELIQSLLRELAALAAGTPITPAAAAVDHDFASTPALLDRLTSSYVRRPDVETWFEDLAAAGGGALWIEAPAGAGKSTAMAQLCRDRDAIQHFVTPSEGRSSITAVLRSLIGQLVRRSGLRIEPTAADDGLVQQFSNLLINVSMNQTTPLFVVIDGLDELGSADAIARLLASLPDPLPAKVCVVVSSRPIPPTWRVGRMFTRRALPALTLSMLEQVALRHDHLVSRDVCAKAFAASEGNPLFALWALRILAEDAQREIDLHDIVEDYFGAVLGFALEEDDDESLQRMLAALVASGSPLDLPTLAAATSVPRARLLRHLDTIRDLVAVVNGKVALIHKLIADYLSDERNLMALDGTIITAMHRALAVVAMAPGTSYPPLAAPYHVLRARAMDLAAGATANETMVDGFPPAFVRVADDDPQTAYDLLDLLCAGLTSESSGLLHSILVMLVDTGHADLVRRALRERAGETLTTRHRDLVELWVAWTAGDNSQVLTTSARLLDEQDDEWTGECHLLRAQALRIGGSHRDALVSYERAGGLLTWHTPIVKFTASFQLADLAYVYGELTRAREVLNELDGLTVAQGLPALRSRVLRELGHIELCSGRDEAAAALYRQALDIAVGARQANRIAECYNSLAEATASTDPQRAHQLVQSGREWALRASMPIEAGKSSYIEAEILLGTGDATGALELGRRSLRELTEVGYSSGGARAQAAIAGALLASGDVSAEASEQARSAIEYYAREQIYPELRVAAIELGRQIVAAGGDRDLLTIDSMDHVPNLEEFPQSTRWSAERAR